MFQAVVVAVYVEINVVCLDNCTRYRWERRLTWLIKRHIWYYLSWRDLNDGKKLSAELFGVFMVSGAFDGVVTYYDLPFRSRLSQSQIHVLSQQSKRSVLRSTRVVIKNSLIVDLSEFVVLCIQTRSKATRGSSKQGHGLGFCRNFPRVAIDGMSKRELTYL